MSAAAMAVVERYERSLSAQQRRDGGVHYTPPEVCRAVIGEALDTLGRLPGTICDPTCGAGSFLLAAADSLLGAGVPAREVVEERLVGGELDPEAARAARDALSIWAAEHGAADAGPVRLLVGDSLMRPSAQWPSRPTRGFDMVVGNPPFLGQLARRTSRSAAERTRVRERFGAAFGYADSASLFLLDALELVAPGGVVSLIQPQSFLAARDTAPIRDALLSAAELVSLWGSDDQLFDAAVRVCAPVLRRHASGTAAGSPVRIRWGSPPRSTSDAPAPGQGSWGPLLADVHGIPRIGHPAEASGAPSVLGELATATAGFRDEYYGLRDALVDDGSRPDAPRLVTVGMIEPGWSSWGQRPRRFGGQMRAAPRLDEQALADASPRVARWASARQVPKVLVATQTRVVEAAPDPVGDIVPVTPLISVEPRSDATDVWLLTAALLAPPVSADALARHLGLGLSSSALRWSASAVLDVRLPVRRELWEQGAELCRLLVAAEPDARDALLRRLGRVMCDAHALSADHAVLDWWGERVLRS